MMNYSTLKQKLGIENNNISDGQIEISNNSLTENLAALFEYCYNNQPVVINSATISKDDENAGQIVIEGISDFLGVPDLKTSVTFSIDNHGDVQILLKYALLGAAPGVNDWKFSKSFPDMPKVENGNEPMYFDRETGAVTKSYVHQLDLLYFYNSFFIVTSFAHTDSDSNKPLDWGINFISKLRPDGLLGIIEHVFQSNNELTVYGTIRRPRNGESPKQTETKYSGSKKQFQYPWTVKDDFEYGVPGILLMADLDMQYTAVKGKLDFKADKIYFYNPVNGEWEMQQTNPQFIPMFAYTGSITLPGAGIEMDIIVPQEIGDKRFLLISQFEGLSLNNLSHLTGISGGESPLSHLPNQLQEMGGKLGELSLTSATFEINYEDLKDIHVSYVTFTIGMPELNWVVWKDHFEIDSIVCEFDIANPFATSKGTSSGTDYIALEKKVDVKIYGSLEIEDVPFDVFASTAEGFEVFAEMHDKQTVPLKSILKKYFPDLEPPGNLTVNILRFGVTGGKSYSFAMELADKPNTWSIPIGGHTFDVYDVYMTAQCAEGSGMSGSVGGTLSFDDIATLYLNYDTPGDITIRTQLKEAGLKKILGTLGVNALAVPDSFDLELHNSSLLLQKQSSNYMLQLATELEGFGSLALQVQETNGQWGAAFGVDITQGHPIDLPGLKPLKPLFDSLTLNNFLLVVSTFDSPSFLFPELASFNNPSLSSSSIPMPKGAGGVVAGLNIHASWTLDTGDKAQKLIKNILGLDPRFDVTLQVSEIPTENSRLYVKYNTKIAGGHPLSCQFGFALMQGEPEMYLEGTLETQIAGKPCRFDVAMSLLLNGVFFAGSMEGTVAFEGVQLSNLAIAFGFDWEGIPSVGIAATIDTSDFDSSIALLFDSTDPAKSLMAGAISDLTLYNIVDFFVKEVEKAEGVTKSEDIPQALEGVLSTISLTGTESFKIPASKSESFDHMDLTDISAAFQQYGKVSIPSTQGSLLVVMNEKGKSWSLTDKMNNMRHYQVKKEGENLLVSLEAQLYISPEGAQMGKLVYPPGFFLDGAVSILGMKWTTQIETRKNKGIEAESNINKPLVIYKPEFFKLSDVSGKTGPVFSFSTFTQPEQKNPELRPPHLYFSGHISLLGVKAEAYIKATKEGFKFDINESLELTIPGKVLSGSIQSGFDIHGSIGSHEGISVGVSISLDVKGDLNLGEMRLFDGIIDVDFGKIELDMSVGGSIDMGYDGKEAYINVDAHFDFDGSTHHFSKKLEAGNADIKKAGEWVLDELKDIFKEMFETAEQWADAVKNGLVALEKGAEQMARVLKDGFKMVDKEAMALLHDAGHDFEEIGNAFASVYGTTAKEMSEFMGDMGADAEQIADTLKNSFKSGEKEVAKLVNDLEHTTPEDVANAMKHAFKQSPEEAAKTMQAIGMEAEDIARGLKGSFKQTAQQAIKQLDHLGVHIEVAGKILSSVYKQSAHDAARTLKALRKDGEAIGHALKSGYKKTARQVAQVMNAVGVGAGEISKAMKGVFKQSAKDMASTLKFIKKGDKVIARVLKNVYKQPAKECAVLLGGVRAGLSSVSAALKDVYKLDHNGVAHTLKSIHKTANQVSMAMKSAFHISAKNMAGILHHVKFNPSQVGGVLRNVYHQSSEAAADILKGMNMGSDYVADVLKNAYHLSTGDAGKLLKSTFNLGEDSLKTVMKGAGYASKEVDNFANSAFKSLKSAAKSVKHFFGL